MENLPFIVHLIRPATGGMQNHVLELVGGLSKKGYPVAVITPPNEMLELRLKLIDVASYQVPISDRLSPTDLINIIRLARLLKRLRPDILHIHGNKTALVGGIAAFLAGVPATVVTVHSYLMYQNAKGLKKAVASFIDRRLAGRASKIITVSDSLKRSLVDSERFESSKISVIHNGIDLDRWRNQPATRSIPTRPNLKVIIAGDGPLFDELSKSIRDRRLEANIWLLGHVADTRPLLALSDIFCLPSKNEPFGLVLLEAMAAGLPVVAANSGGVPEIIEDGLSGVLAPPGDVAALSGAIESLADDEGKRRQLAAAGLAGVKTRFTLGRVVERTETIYREVLINRHSA
ncbi:MAG: glycosyltransferase [Actinomycetota bacterium]|nr:glycosyltransferase [Actinomycetota bacterium]